MVHLHYTRPRPVTRMPWGGEFGGVPLRELRECDLRRLASPRRRLPAAVRSALNCELGVRTGRQVRSAEDLWGES